MIAAARIALAAAALALTGQAIAADPWAGDGGLPAFYAWTAPLPQRPGVMLRTEPAPDAVSLPGAASAERILYSSTDWRDPRRIIPVSGILFVPAGTPPKGGWPLIGWAHGTTGTADICAPSALPRSERDRLYLGVWLAKGFAIVASDYQGLGTPGTHAYLQYRAEGLSVLDSLRAVLAHDATLSPRKLFTMGQSQGSEGAIAAAYLAPAYAPDLHILGTVATGIVAHAAQVGAAHQVALPAIYPDPADYANSAYEALWFLGAARTIDPATIRPETYLSADGLRLVAEAQHSCMRELVAFARQQKIPIAHFYKRPTDRLEALVTRRTAFPDARVTTPVFIGTGLDDKDAQPAKQYNLASAMCAAGSLVEMHYYAGADHSQAVDRSLADSPAFVDALLAGRRIAGNCATLQPPPGAK